MKKSFENFGDYSLFPQEVLREIIRDGETEMQARLATANAADQRALTLAGFQITLAVAMVAACYTLLTSQAKDVELALGAGLYTLAMMISASFAIQSVTPKLFCYPGNDPVNWNYLHWHHDLNTAADATLSMALVEMCYTLHTGLYDNKSQMERNARKLKCSISVMVYSSGIGAFAALFILGSRI